MTSASDEVPLAGWKPTWTLAVLKSTFVNAMFWMKSLRPVTGEVNSSQPSSAAGTRAAASQVIDEKMSCRPPLWMLTSSSTYRRLPLLVASSTALYLIGLVTGKFCPWMAVTKSEAPVW